MGSGLIQNYSAKYIQQANTLTNRPQRIKVMVEDDVDIRFWHDILTANSTGHDFQVISYYNMNGTCSIVRGKDHILQKINLGEGLRAGVDSDYDYLLPDLNINSAIINASSYVLHTYTYSIENYLCHPDVLGTVCVNLTAEYPSFNFPQFYIKLSNIVYPLFVWSLFLEYIDKDNIRKKFPRNLFMQILRSDKIATNNNGQEIIDDINIKVNIALKDLKNRYPHYELGMNIFQKTLASYGINTNNTYLFIHGHALFNLVVDNILLPICKQLRSNHKKNIYSSNASKEDIENRIQRYDKQYGFVGTNEKDYIEKELNKCFLYKNYPCNPYYKMIDLIAHI